MKKVIALLLVLVMTMALFAGCAKKDNTPAGTTQAPGGTTEVPGTTNAPEVPVMTHEEYLAAAIDSAVCVEFYVQGAQGWWFDSDANHGKITVYGQDAVGGYFAYEMKCDEADAAKLVPGTKIRVTGYKAEWSGEVEIVDATFEIIEGDTFVAKPLDVTDLLGTDDLIKHQNMFVAFKGVTVEKIEYKNGTPGDDIYVTVGYGGASYSFCVEMYLTGPDTDVYKAVGELQVGDKIDVEGFLYWYEGVNTHITGVSAAAMSHEEYMAADIDSAVTVEFYVQGAQGWWFDSKANHGKITVYGQDEVGGYFAYEMKCDEADAAKLVPGTKIRVTGYKAEWSGEVEIVDATFDFVEGDAYKAEALDVTNLLGTDDLVKHQNMLVAFKGVTVEKIEYKNGTPGDDIYVTVGYNGASYSFCVEMYLTGPDTEVYKTVGELQTGDVIDVEGFLYWYEGVNTHITAVSKVG